MIDELEFEFEPCDLDCMQRKGGHSLQKFKGTMAGLDQPPSSSEEEKQMLLDMIRLLMITISI